MIWYVCKLYIFKGVYFTTCIFVTLVHVSLFLFHASAIGIVSYQ